LITTLCRIALQNKLLVILGTAAFAHHYLHSHNKAGSWEKLSIQSGAFQRDLRTAKSQDKGSSWNGGWR